MSSTSSSNISRNGIDKGDGLLQTWHECVRLEHDEERQETRERLTDNTCQVLQERGAGVTALKLTDAHIGWFNRVVLVFASAKQKPKADSGNRDGGRDGGKRDGKGDASKREEEWLFSVRNGEILGLYEWRGSKRDSPPSTLDFLGEVVAHKQSRRDEVQVVMPTELFEDLTAAGRLDLFGGRFALFLYGSEVTYGRRMKILQTLATHTLFNQMASSPICLYRDTRIDTHAWDIPHFDHLNDLQREAVKFCITNTPVSCLHGPPGTGKTTTVEAIVRTLVQNNKKVLLCAPSNIAVDNILERCIDMKCVRLGHPSRIDDKLLKMSFEHVAAQSDSAQLCRDIRKEIESCTFNSKRKKDKNTAKDKKTAKEKSHARREMQMQVRELRSELKRREKQTSNEVFSQANIVASTCCGAMAGNLFAFIRTKTGGDGNGDGKGDGKGDGYYFDYVVIDEAGQCAEMDTWMAASLGRFIILAGDPKQLGPTIKSMDAVRLGFGESLMSRVIEQCPDRSYLLRTQYRMNEEIMSWSSDYFYASQLIAHESVARHSVNDTVSPMLWVDTGNVDDACHELKTFTKDQEKSKNFLGLVDEETMRSLTIGVISPYARQVNLLRRLLRGRTSHLNIEISTVDGFQGRECDVILLSLVRSNDEANVGFLNDPRRLNVAITRAKKHCCIIGDSVTVSSCDLLASLWLYCCDRERVISCLNLMTLEEIQSCDVEDFAHTSTRPSPARLKETPSRPKETPSRPKETASRGKETAQGLRDGRGTHGDEQFKQRLRERFTKEIQPIKYKKKGWEEFNGLTPLERRIVHELAEEFDLMHLSVELRSKEKVLYVWRSDGPSPPSAHPPPQESPPVQSPSVQSPPKQSHPHGSALSPAVEKAGETGKEAEAVPMEAIPGEAMPGGSFNKESLPVQPSARQATPELKSVTTIFDVLGDSADNVKSSEDVRSAQGGQETQPGTHQDTQGDTQRKEPRTLTELRTLQKKQAQSTQPKKGAAGLLSRNDIDDDNLLDALIERKKITTIGLACKYCGGTRFCFRHAQAEIHGCGDNARKWARAKHGRK